MSSDLQCLDSTPINSSKLPSSLPQPSNSQLNRALIYVAQEVTELLQQSHPGAVNCDNNPVETVSYGQSETIAIRAIEPEYRQIITTEPLTERELEVLQLIVNGYSNSAIAGELYIAVGTVKTHVRNLYQKLCVQGRTQAAIRALRSGLVH